VPAPQAISARFRVALRVAVSHCSHSWGALRLAVGVQEQATADRAATVLDL